MRYELAVALRYLRARRQIAFISVTTLFTAIGVTIGVAALIVTLSVMNGMEASIAARVLNLSPQIQIQHYDGSLTNYAEVEAKADAVRGVTGSTAYIVGQAMLTSGHGVTGVIVRGVDLSRSAGVANLRRYINQGELKNLEAPPAPLAAVNTNITMGELAVGEMLAAKLHLKVGDPVRLISPVLGESGITTNSGNFTVGAIFESGELFIDRTVAFMNLPNAQTFFGRAGKADGVEVRLTDLALTRAVTAKLKAVFAYPYRVRDWVEFNQAASAGLAMLRRVYSVVLLLLIGVAAFNLVATLIMVVMEKRKDIAILMTMGAKAGDVRMIFTLKGLVVGALGTLGGLVLGGVGDYLLAHYHFIHLQKEIFGFSTVPIEVAPLNFAAVGLSSLLLCLLATFYPARRASRQLPVEIIRYE